MLLKGRVSRQWLYKQPDLRAEIERLSNPVSTRVPNREGSSEAALQQRLRTIADQDREDVSPRGR